MENQFNYKAIINGQIAVGIIKADSPHKAWINLSKSKGPWKDKEGKELPNLKPIKVYITLIPKEEDSSTGNKGLLILSSTEDQEELEINGEKAKYYCKQVAGQCIDIDYEQYGINDNIWTVHFIFMGKPFTYSFEDMEDYGEFLSSENLYYLFEFLEEKIKGAAHV